MSRFRSLTTRRCTSLAVAAVAALFAGAVAVSIAKDVAGTAPIKKKLTGEQLFAVNCARCHSERYGTERTKAEWNTIMMHMRVRANLPASQAKEILKYLQENSGTNP
jgi:mono/diheme cytochrome c family protein